MAEERVQRRLAAILAADVVGYTRLMQQDEAGTLAQLKTLRREIFDPKTTQYGGHIFKNTGDGALTEFQSGVGAVECAVEIQRVLALRNAEVPEDRRIILRLGIGLGDVIVDGEDLYGNAVNVAARMEGLAEPGSICVSGNVREHVGNSIDVNFEDLGEQTVKNIDQPIRVYRVLPVAEQVAAAASMSDAVLITLNPELTALSAAYGQYKWLTGKAPDVSASLLVNRVSGAEEAQEISKNFCRLPSPPDYPHTCTRSATKEFGFFWTSMTKC